MGMKYSPFLARVAWRRLWLIKARECYLSLFFFLFQIKAQRQEAVRIQKEQQLIAKQQSMLNLQPFVTDVEVNESVES